MEKAAGEYLYLTHRLLQDLHVLLFLFPDLLKISDPNNPFFSIILAKTQTGLPPAYFQVSGVDPLRDEGLLYEKLLREAGIKTKLDVYVNSLLGS